MFKIVLLLNYNNLINFLKSFYYNLIEMATLKGVSTKFSRINQYLNLTVKCLMRDGRTFVGLFKAFDKHMNVVLINSTEFRRVRRRKDKNDPKSLFVIKEEKRRLGMIILRGEHIVCVEAEGGQQPVARAAPSRRGPPPSHPGSGSGYARSTGSRSTASSRQSRRGGR